MLVRVLSKTFFSVFAAGTVLTLTANDAFARGWGGWGGWGGSSSSGSSGSVPEIGTGAAAGALALLTGGAFLLKDRFFSAKNDKSAE